MTIKKISSEPILFATLLFLFSCSTNGGNENKGMQDSNEAKNTQLHTTKGVKVYSIPAPLQVSSAIKACGFKFDDRILSPTDRRKEFENNFLKALNLGIYGADLGYTTVFDQKQKALYYFNEMQKISDQLGITGSFGTDIANRFKNNQQHPDSLYRIILDSYSTAHTFLNANDRKESGLLISTGCFIENLHLLCRLAVSKEDPRVATLIAYQQVYLKNLMALLQPYRSSKDIEFLLTGLNGLAESFGDIPAMPPAAADVTRDFLPTQSVVIPQSRLAALTEQITALRMKIIS